MHAMKDITPSSSSRPLTSLRPVISAIAVALLSIAAGSSRIAQPSFATTNGGSITTLGVLLTENFDTLAPTGTAIPWTDNSTIPGWYSTRAAYNSGTGSSSTGALYSFGVAGANPVTDRALGSVASGGTLTVLHAARLTNSTGGTIDSLDVSYAGEQWRNGGNTAAHTLTFQYQVADPGIITGANAPATGWITVPELSFTGPITGATAAALDGNAPGNRIVRLATLAVTVANGREIWFRWQDPDDGGNDHGLAVDDFSVTAGGSPGDGAPTVGGTAPANAATNVAVDSAIVINFNESVNATGNAFTVECPAGAPQPFAQTASPASAYTLTPAADLPFSTTCTVTVAASQISDADTGDLPDAMAADFSFSFATAGPPPPVATNVIINELDSDTPGADAAEFVELYDGGVGNTRSTAGRRVLQRLHRPVRTRPSISMGCKRTRAATSRSEISAFLASILFLTRTSCRTAPMRSRSWPATPPTSPTARPSPRRISWTPSSTTQTMRTIPDCWRC